ncbi:MAG: P1 family peptidase [Synergistaceae bacterium]|jgi:D-aminopeptidase|nr:P1 family peptidase [Synergistaceae bacterium]
MFGLRPRLRDYGLVIGGMRPGPRNAITDIEGVTVGHCTADDPERGIHTGVTVVIPAPDQTLFENKVTAGAYIFNGFGKSAGLMQIEEKGTLETPVVLTGVSSVGAMYDALFHLEMTRNSEICRTSGSVNPLVCECNDSFLNNARATRLGRGHLDAAFASASVDFDEGAVGAGRGMSCFGLKGGIGSSSRVFEAAEHLFTVGVLVNANFGELPCLTVAGRCIGPRLEALMETPPPPLPDSGSIIIVIATNAPLNSRQLKRLCKRAFIGVGRTGSFVGDGSGDIAVAFSTGCRIPHVPPASGLVPLAALHEEYINPFFRATAEATEEAILNALLAAVPLKGRDGSERRALTQFWEKVFD